MDEYKPINVHGILLTAVHDGSTGDLEELDSSGTLATTGPAMIIRSVIRIRH